MKKLIPCVCLMLLLTLAPGETQGFTRLFWHRPILHHHGAQPLVNILPTIPGAAIGNILGPPANALPGTPPANSQIMVDSAVPTSIAATKQNLDTASTIINDLLKKNGVSQPAASSASTLPVVKGISAPAKTGPVR